MRSKSSIEPEETNTRMNPMVRLESPDHPDDVQVGPSRKSGRRYKGQERLRKIYCSVLHLCLSQFRVSKEHTLPVVIGMTRHASPCSIMSSSLLSSGRVICFVRRERAAVIDCQCPALFPVCGIEVAFGV